MALPVGDEAETELQTNPGSLHLDLGVEALPRAGVLCQTGSSSLLETALQAVTLSVEGEEAELRAEVEINLGTLHRDLEVEALLQAGVIRQADKPSLLETILQAVILQGADALLNGVVVLIPEVVAMLQIRITLPPKISAMPKGTTGALATTHDLVVSLAPKIKVSFHQSNHSDQIIIESLASTGKTKSSQAKGNNANAGNVSSNLYFVDAGLDNVSDIYQ